MKILLLLMLSISLLFSMLRTTEELKDLKLKAIYGDIKSQIELGNEYLESYSNIHDDSGLYGSSHPNKEDIEKALRWYKKAAKKGSVEAEYHIATVYHWKMMKSKIAEEWYEKGLNHKDITEREKEFEKYIIETLLILYQEYDFYDKYEYVLERAAKKDYEKYQLQFGVVLLKNENKEGLKYIQMAAEKEYMPAVVTLGQIYLYGKSLIKKDSAKGIYWLKIAADKGGLAEARPTIDLAIEYCKGENIKKDLKECTRYFNKAKELLKGYPEAVEEVEKVRKSLM